MRSADVYLNFAGDARQAFEHYSHVFGIEPDAVMTYTDFGGAEAGFTGADLERVAHVSIKLTPSFWLMGSDVPSRDDHKLAKGTNAYVNLNVESPEEGRRLFEALLAGGKVEHPLERTSWAQLYGSLVDRFGVRWMINLAAEQG